MTHKFSPIHVLQLCLYSEETIIGKHEFYLTTERAAKVSMKRHNQENVIHGFSQKLLKVKTTKMKKIIRKQNRNSVSTLQTRISQ